jgi:nitrate/TMAO reductase-like tetraheme cytochrome c subunit
VSAELPPSRGFGAWLWRRPRRWFLLGVPIGGAIAFVVGVTFTGGFVGGLKLAETDAFCTSCHEMSTPFQEYTHSVHYANAPGIRASCGNCHVPPTFVAALVRHMEATTEVWGHLTGELDTPAKYEAHRAEFARAVWKEMRANDSAECRSCHTQSAMALGRQNAFAAARHAPNYMQDNHLTCIDCHKGVAHTLPGAG